MLFCYALEYVYKSNRYLAIPFARNCLDMDKSTIRLPEGKNMFILIFIALKLCQPNPKQKPREVIRSGQNCYCKYCQSEHRTRFPFLWKKAFLNLVQNYLHTQGIANNIQHSSYFGQCGIMEVSLTWNKNTGVLRGFQDFDWFYWLNDILVY